MNPASLAYLARAWLVLAGGESPYPTTTIGKELYYAAMSESGSFRTWRWTRPLSNALDAVTFGPSGNPRCLRRRVRRYETWSE